MFSMSEWILIGISCGCTLFTVIVALVCYSFVCENRKKQAETLQETESVASDLKNKLTTLQTKRLETIKLTDTPRTGSLLVDTQIKEMCEMNELIVRGYDAKKVEPVSYDLTIDSIHFWEFKDNRMNTTESEKDDIEIITADCSIIHPRQMAIIFCEEFVAMPKNVIGRIVGRNSYIRMGLQISAPLYQPGHHTKISFCVYNLTDYDISLSKGDSIAHMYFEVLGEEPSVVYGEHDQYQNEYNLTIPKDKISKHVKEDSGLEKKIDDMEAKIYTIMSTFMGAFVSVLCLLVVNFEALQDKGTDEILKINLSLAFCIVAILGMVFLFCYALTSKRKKPHKRTKHSKKKDK